LKKPTQKRAGGVAQGVGFEFKPQYWKKKGGEEERPKLTSLLQLAMGFPHQK
jgi:hypothetical protein